MARHVMLDVGDELRGAQDKHRPMASAHEGWAVIKEELDELWDEVRKGGSLPRNAEAMRHEAIQVAAMAVRFAIDICDRNVGDCGTPTKGA